MISYIVILWTTEINMKSISHDMHPESRLHITLSSRNVYKTSYSDLIVRQ